MGNTGSESALAVLTGDMCGRTSGSIYRGQRTGKKMGGKKQTQPQARRDSDGVVRGSVHGDQGSTESATDSAGATEVAPTNTTSKLPTETRRVDTETAVLVPIARVRSFTAKPCTNCEQLREPGTNFSRVYATRGNVRYCRCDYCGHTWKDSDSVPHSGS